MKNSTITIVDYGMGNLWSVINALNFLGAEPVVSGDPDEVANAEKLLLPGVGSFGKAIQTLRTRGLDQAIIHAVKNRERNILGICLGMQLMGLRGTEDGNNDGLGFIDAAVEPFSEDQTASAKIPHVGFNTVCPAPGQKLFQGLSASTDFYFVHSYRMMPTGLEGKIATCDHGEKFVAAYEADNIFATQFHPEKSQTNGLLLLRNFLAI